MSPAKMAMEAAAAIAAGTHMTLVVPVPFNRPPKFPRGELLCENGRGERVYSYDPIRVMAWLVANGLVKASVVPTSTRND